ncbi:hypothetical protein NHX12_025820 [Muraenolepis orangiensis]|uniref:Uncharacterized protein n=1 Tax=Muraenolepis orangiensis TaxID=630683 RepID=A0A9Q0EGE3_9TELE|nr:hypothetical protein NHX12_025820 [Muraenolepis orangiensis]
MKRLFRKLSVAVVVLVWLGALAYLLVLSRKKLPEPGALSGGDTHRSQRLGCPVSAGTRGQRVGRVHSGRQHGDALLVLMMNQPA